MNDYDYIIVGSGAGGGLLAYRLSGTGKRVALIEAGSFYGPDSFNRFELQAVRKLWWPSTWTSNHERNNNEPTEEMMLGMGRCVGGSTTIFTAVAHRAFPENIDNWHNETGMLNFSNEPISYSDLDQSYRRVETETKIRKYTEWDRGTEKIAEGFKQIGHPLSPVDAFVTPACNQNACLFGCPTNAKTGSLVTYIIPAIYNGVDLYPDTFVTEVMTRKSSTDKPLEAYGIKYRDKEGNTGTMSGKAVILSAGALQTPQILLRSGIREKTGYTKSSMQIGQNLGVNIGSVMYGVFDEDLYNWILHPLSANISEFALEKNGGFLLEASTVFEAPIGFTDTLLDADGNPVWGRELKRITKDYRKMAGVFINTHDMNNGSVEIDDSGKTKLYKKFTQNDREHFRKARDLVYEAMQSVGVKEVMHSVYLSHHVQGTCRIGENKEKSVVDSNYEMHDVSNLFVGDGSLIPSVIDANPSLTIYALADRLSNHLIQNIQK